VTALGLLDCCCSFCDYQFLDYDRRPTVRSPKETSEVRSEGLRLSAGRACASVFGVVGIKLLIKSVVIKDLAIVYPTVSKSEYN